ncbi:hypothetical protein [Cryobacterium sp. PH31-L1]|uniref:hypothetical protein n=1 Tax=Cryobacterium sp. PH31-L1 TaxID=3046199 RepID=UPI0024BB4A9C|nr:hypothetical protein [Cryobacterium sp. PH31-L1]MDJ0377159.1 hypothetical protein [Cryobacterium sp. PH31-L1]
MLAKLKRVVTAIVVAGLVAVVMVAVPQKAEALTGAEFNPGYIISDAQFYARDAMSQDQIQAFLDAQIGTCQNSLCLNVLRINTTTTTLAFGTCATYPGEANESAARMIYKVQQACSISAKVLLVTLQKEQGLVTSKAPTEAILRKALGQGCPDTAQCDSAYYGFFMQVYSAARQFAWYGNPAGSHTSIKVGQTNAVLFHPNSACGSSNVVIQNRATAALYYYTPYQPNSAALANLGGVGDGCSSYGNRNFWVYYNNWFGSPSAGTSPIGNIESVRGAIGGVTVVGWAIDPDTANSIDVHVYVDGVGTPTSAALERTDIGAMFPAYGNAHGFNIAVPVRFSGTHSVCVYGFNVLGGDNTLFGCSNVVANGGSPIAGIDAVVGSAGAISINGWAIDPDSAGPMSVHAYVDGVGTAFLADKLRKDVGIAFPGYGDNHGFSYSIDATEGVHEICLYGINIGSGTNVQFGCYSVSIPIAERGRVPVGVLEAVSPVAGGVNIVGWALDPDTANPITVDVKVDGIGSVYQANKARTDLGAAWPGYGGNHGFAEVVAVAAGPHEVCAYARNSGPGVNTVLGCSSVTVASPERIAEQGRLPIGAIEAARPTAAGIDVSGWAFDPDTASPISVHVYVDGVSAAYVANKSRPDVGSAFPGYGDNHGFTESIVAAAGAHRVCVYAINSGPGTHPAIGCGAVTVPETAGNVEKGRTPIGSLDEIRPVAGGVVIGGWALDPDTTSSIPVHVYVDGVGTAYTSNKSRPDVAAAYPGYGDSHGYSEVVPAVGGSHHVCVYAINAGPGLQLLMGCSTVAVPQ